MTRATPFPLNRSRVLLALISAAFAVEASAAAGRVEFAFGGVSVTGADGRTRPATRGAELDNGDVVRTTDGRVQIRMTDGSYISLQPNSEWGIKNYRFEGKTDGSESAIYSLVKGAMRTVTGLVGRVNRNRYQVGTPTATVGIRGTGGLIQVLPDGSTLVQGTSGIWFLANPSGSIDIPAGVSGLAPADPKQPPRETTAVPVAGPTPPTVQDEPQYVQGDQRTPSGQPVLTPTGVLASGSGYRFAAAFSSSATAQIGAVLDSGSATFDPAGQMTAAVGSLIQPTLGSGRHADFGSDGIIAWGRWVGNPTIYTGASQEIYSDDQGFHYVVGMPTATMPQSGTATYTLMGATRPTYTGSTGVGTGTLSGSLTVNFAPGAGTVGMNLNVAMPDRSYGINGSAPISGATFQTTSLMPTGCFSTCSAKVAGFFAGPSAERAGLSYHINDFSNNNGDILGAAAFQR